MRRLSFIPVLFAAAILCFGAGPKSRNLKEALTLQIPEGSGNYGASVAWNPKKHLYYAVFGGNPDFPLCIYDKKGKLLKGDLKPGIDVRGLWYNKKSGCLEGNGFKDFGYFTIALDDKGYPGGKAIPFPTGMHQPDENSVGAYIPETDQVIFRQNETLYFYNRQTGDNVSSMIITGLPARWESINTFAIIYTGEKKKEIGLYDYYNHCVYLVNQEDGTCTETLNLPYNAPKTERLGFSYSNGIYWVYNKDQRKWYGYR